jgi:hypothetical protein
MGRRAGRGLNKETDGYQQNIGARVESHIDGLLLKMRERRLAMRDTGSLAGTVSHNPVWHYSCSVETLSLLSFVQ